MKVFPNSNVVLAEGPRSHSNKENSTPKSAIAFGSRYLEKTNCDRKKANFSRPRGPKDTSKNTQKEGEKKGGIENEESSENISDNLSNRSSRDSQKQQEKKACREKQGHVGLGTCVDETPYERPLSLPFFDSAGAKDKVGSGSEPRGKLKVSNLSMSRNPKDQPANAQQLNAAPSSRRKAPATLAKKTVATVPPKRNSRKAREAATGSCERSQPSRAQSQVHTMERNSRDNAQGGSHSLPYDASNYCDTDNKAVSDKDSRQATCPNDPLQFADQKNGGGTTSDGGSSNCPSEETLEVPPLRYGNLLGAFMAFIPFASGL